MTLEALSVAANIVVVAGNRLVNETAKDVLWGVFADLIDENNERVEQELWEQIYPPN